MVIDNKKVVSQGKGVPWFGWISGQEYKDGILNDYTSSIYMQNKYFQITNERIDIKTMAERARNNEPTAKLIFNEMGNTLGFFLKKNFVEEFKTECIIFGGQIINPKHIMELRKIGYSYIKVQSKQLGEICFVNKKINL